MKKTLKIPAILGMILSLVCIFYLSKALLYTYFPAFFDVKSDEPIAWGAGLFGLIVSVFSLIFYGIDAYFSAKVIKKENSRLNMIIVALYAICLILGIWVIFSNLRDYKSIIWYVSYFSLFIVETISTIRHFLRKNIFTAE